MLKNVTTNETLATLAPNLDASTRVLSMPVALFTGRGGFAIHRDDVLTVTDAYNNPTGKSLPDSAMGIVVGYFLPDDPSTFAALRHHH